MKKLRNIIIVALFLTQTLQATAQINELEFFADSSVNKFESLSHTIKMTNGIVYTGVVIQGSNDRIPFVSRIDTSGEVIWSTLNFFRTSLNNAYWFSLFDGNDGFIYALTNENNQQSNNDKIIWKIDAQTGKIIYRQLFYQRNYFNMKIANYDSTYFLATYETNTGNQSNIALLKKSDGDTVKTAFFFNALLGNVNATADKSGNVIHSVGKHVRKYNGHDFNEIVWEGSYDNGPTVNLENIEKLYVDDYNELYLLGRGTNVFGSRDYGIFKKIDINTGQELWGANATISLSTLAVSNFVDQNGFLYVSFRHATVGSVAYRYHFSKINKQTGNVAVSSSYFIAPGSTTSNGAFQQSSSLAVDCNGDVYLNGTYSFQHSTSSYTHHWGVIKVNGVSGNKIYDRTYGSNSTSSTYRNQGVASYTYGDRVIFLGILLNGPVASATYINYDAVNDSTKFIKELNNGFQTPSKVLQMYKHNDSLLVLKKEGKVAYFTLYDKLGRKVYEKRINAITAAFSGALTTDGNKVIIALEEKNNANTIPYFMGSFNNIIWAREYDFKTGGLQNTTSALLPGGTIKFEEIEILNGIPYLFFDRNGSYYTRWGATGLSSPTYISFNTIGSYEVRANRVYNNDSSLLFFNNTGVVEYNSSSNFPNYKASFSSSGSFNIYDFTQINDTLYLAGKNRGTSKPSVLAYDKKNDTVLWINTFGYDGEFTRINNKNGTLYVAGNSDTSIVVHALNSHTSTTDWTIRLDSLPYLNGKVYDMDLSDLKNQVAISGAININGTRSNGIVGVFDLPGTTNGTFKLSSLTELPTYANQIVSFQDSGFWFGGAINRESSRQEGFLFALNTQPSIVTSTNEFPKSRSANLNQLLIYPNPTKNQLFIKGLTKETFNYSVIDVAGRVVFSKRKVRSNQLDVAKLSKGTYFIVIEEENRIERFTFIKL